MSANKKSNTKGQHARQLIGMRNLTLFGAILSLLLGVGVARSATRVVTTTADPGSGVCALGGCSLRDAINGAASNDTITFAIPSTDAGCSSPNLCTITIDPPTGTFEVAINNLTIDGSAQNITIDGGGLVQIMNNTGTGLQINSLNLAHGACLDLTFSTDFRCYYGGGIGNFGTLTVTNSTFLGNYAGKYCSVSPRGHEVCDSQPGGAIVNWGTVSIANSTFIGNSSDDDQEGAAIANFTGTLTITNSTFSGNSGHTTIYNGAGVADGFDPGLPPNNLPGNLIVINSTLSGASAAAVGNTNQSVPGTVTLYNTIIAGSSGGDCLAASSLYLPITDGGGNLSDDPTCGFTQATSLNSTNPHLGTLQDNGGPTQTIALIAPSPAIDAIPIGTSFCQTATNAILTDQRGVSRPQGAACDIGAYESQPDFSISAYPASAIIFQGRSGTFTISTAVTSGSPGIITLAASGLPSGVTVSFSPTSVIAGGTSTLTVSVASSAAPTTKALFKVIGTDTSGSRTANVAITIQPVPPPDFSLSVDPASQSVERGDAAKYTVSIAPFNGFTGSVTLRIRGEPRRSTVNCTPNPTTSTSVCKVKTWLDTLRRSHLLTITGTSGSLSHTTTAELIVTGKGK